MKKLICLLLALVMVMAMTACGDENKKPYEEAVAAYNNSMYEEAAEKLAALGDYKDAAQQLSFITAKKSGVSLEIANADKSKDTYEYTCDESGKVISHVLTLSDGTVEEASYNYNDQGLLTAIAATSDITNYEYNAFGDLVKESVEANGEVVSATTYAYVYTFIVSK